MPNAPPSLGRARAPRVEPKGRPDPGPAPVRESAASRGYDRAWRRLASAVLARHPLCARCAGLGRVRPADLVDHVEPVRARPDLRLDAENLQPLCAPCHDGPKRRAEADAARLGIAVRVAMVRHGWRMP